MRFMATAFGANRDLAPTILESAAELRGELDRLILPLSEAAADVVRTGAWAIFGWAHLGDYARETLRKSSRWVRDLATLHASMEKMPPLRDAVAGRDGPAIGRCAALWIGRTASIDTVSEWIALARRSTTADIQQAIRVARTIGRAGPVIEAATDAEFPRLDPEADDFAPLGTIRMRVPHPMRVAFDEALDVFRAVSGGAAPVSGFYEALVAEAYSRGWAESPPGSTPSTNASVVARRGITRSRSTTNTSRAAEEASQLLEASNELLLRVRALGCGERTATESTPEEGLAARLRDLSRIEDGIEHALGRSLLWLDRYADWPETGYQDTFECASEVCGWAPTTARTRLQLARTLEKRPILNEACESRGLGFEKAIVLSRLLGSQRVTADLERAWVERALDSDLKALRQELRIVEWKRAGGLPELPPSDSPLDRPAERAEDTSNEGQLSARAVYAPASDAEQRDYRRREPGASRLRIAMLALRAFHDENADVFLGHTVPADIRNRFTSLLEARRSDLESRAAVWAEGNALEVTPEDEASSDNITRGALPAAVVLSRRFVRGKQPVPEWVALCAMLEEFVDTHDDPRAFPRRPWNETYAKAGWICAAPGCTVRFLENHHIRYVSRGGSDEEVNLIALCPWHHRQGEHGIYADCSGTPEELLWGRGREDVRDWYRNDRRIGGPESCAPDGPLEH